MNSNKKNSAKEPAEAYEVTPKVDSKEEVLHPILVQLLDKSIKEANEGKFISHEEAMQKIKEKISSLK